MFAIAYDYLPELREQRDRIMDAFMIRLGCFVLGLVLAYGLVRSVPRPSFAIFHRGAIGSAMWITAALLVGAVPGWLAWCLVEWLAGGYWWWEAWQAGAVREIWLGILGWGVWSFSLGNLLLLGWAMSGRTRRRGGTLESKASLGA